MSVIYTPVILIEDLTEFNKFLRKEIGFNYLGLDHDGSVLRLEFLEEIDTNDIALIESYTTTELSADFRRQKEQREYGESITRDFVDKIGVRNLELSRSDTPANIPLVAGALKDVKLLLEGGALSTTIGLCNAVKPSLPNHADILQELIDNLSTFLNSKGYV